MPHVGLVNDEGIGQSEFMWFLRGNPNIKKVFSHIWNSNELFVSFDGAGCFRNWHLNIKWKTSSSWYHCDQNPFKKPDRCSIQGLVSLTDSDESTGGFVVVPDSHKYFSELKSRTKERLWGDYVTIRNQDPLLEKLHPRLVKCKAGDLIVWDSRSIHCNTPAIVNKEKNNQSELLRIVAYICMSPLSMFVPEMDEFKTLEEFRQLREQYVRDKATCTHWPLELIGDRIHILNYIRCNQMPTESIALDVLHEAEFFCISSLIAKLENSSPCVISLRRRESFRRLIPDYEHMKMDIINKSIEKRSAFHESRVVITQLDHTKLKGTIPCYNCSREFVTVNHACAFDGLTADLQIQQQLKPIQSDISIDMDKLIAFVVDELVHDGFKATAERVTCRFSVRCQSCTLSGLYTAGGILAPRECQNIAHVIKFIWS
ncbi:unnamed protein product [Rotaria sp. Silwood2]|nr:unnamed protein product [Rotaria sp. Silwood2]